MSETYRTEIGEHKRISILVTVFLFVLFVPSSFHPLINAISLYAVIPCFFLYFAILSPLKILIYKPLLYFGLLICWSFITIVKSEDLLTSSKEMRELIGVFLLCFIFVRFCFDNPRYTMILFSLYICKFFTIVYFGYKHGLLTSEERFDIEEIDANSFGYYGFFAIVSSFFIWKESMSRTKILPIIRVSFFILFIICVALSLFTCFVAASRAGIIMSIVITVMFFSIKYFYPISKRTVFFVIIFSVFAIVLFPVLSKVYEGSILNRRFEIESLRDETRYGLFVRAVEVGIQNPILGVGPGNFYLHTGYRNFSHSTYSELFANNGILALSLFLMMLHYSFKRTFFLASIGSTQSKDAFYFFCFFLVYSFYNMFYGFHTKLFLLGFFFVVLLKLETEINNKDTTCVKSK